MKNETSDLAASITNTQSVQAVNTEEDKDPIPQIYQSEACNLFYQVAQECVQKAPPKLKDELKKMMQELHQSEAKGSAGVLSAERQCNMIVGGFKCPF